MTPSPATTKSALPGILAAGLLVYMLFLGGSEAGTFLDPLRALTAAISGALLLWWIWLLRDGPDLGDAAATVALIAFCLACAVSQYPRQSFDPAVAAVAWAAAFGVGRRLLAVEQYRLLLLRLLALCGMLFTLTFAITWGLVWIRWVTLSGSAPPFDLQLPALAYRHYYVVAMLIAAFLPAQIALLPDVRWRYAVVPSVGIGAGLLLLSGSRTVWLALILAIATAVLGRRFTVRRAAVGLAVATAALAWLAVSGSMGAAVDRLLAGGTVSYRLDVWAATLDTFAQHPLFGTGPGSIGADLALSDLTIQYQFTNRHADNAFIQLLAEGGLLATAGAAFALIAVVSRRQAGRRGSHAAAIGLVLFFGMSLTNNPTDSANLVAVAVCYAALLCPFRPAEPFLAFVPRISPAAVRVGTSASLVVVGLAVAATSFAGLATFQARGASDPQTARDLEAQAVAFDPSMALYLRETGVLAVANRPEDASRLLRRVVSLMPADVSALRALAFASAAAENADDALDAARRAVAVRPMEPENWIVLALVSSGAEARKAEAEATRLAPWVLGSPVWPATLGDADEFPAILAAAANASTGHQEPRDPTALVWLGALTGQGRAAPDTAANRALQAVVACDLPKADAEFRSLGIAWTETPAAAIGRIMLARIRGEGNIDKEIDILSLRQPDLAAAASGDVQAYSAFVDLAGDQQLYRRTGVNPLIGDVIVPRSLDSLTPWLVSPVKTAAQVLPGSPLATCR